RRMAAAARADPAQRRAEPGRDPAPAGGPAGGAGSPRGTGRVAGRPEAVAGRAPDAHALRRPRVRAPGAPLDPPRLLAEPDAGVGADVLRPGPASLHGRPLPRGLRVADGAAGRGPH